MQIASHLSHCLSSAEIARIQAGALRILDEMGLEAQNRSLLQSLAEIGASVDFGAQRARFPSQMVERFLAEAEGVDWAKAVPQLESSAGVYHGLYLHPTSEQFESWTENTLAFYFKVARSLPHVGTAHMLGCRLPVPAALEPLYERYYCWKHGAREAGSIFTESICPYLLELYQLRAEILGKSLEQVFKGVVYLIPPLKLGASEAAQVAFFRERGLRVEIGGGMGSMGATAPATVAGAVTLNLAEQLALCILEWALFGEKRLYLGGSLSVMDMRTTIRPYGRPEMAIANIMTAQLARHYGASFQGHAGLSDAKRPSTEAGAQKALTAIPTLLAGGHIWIDAGLLAIDEVCSPVQMVLDNELLSALKHLVRERAIEEESLALETILEAGPGGNYLDKDHTARHFRTEHWEPLIWSRQMLRPWLESGGCIDVGKACKWIADLEQQGPDPPALDEFRQREVLQVIKKARGALAP